MTVAHNPSWKSWAERCFKCGWLFSCRADDLGRTRCQACTSKMGELRLVPPVAPVRLGAKARLEAELRQAVENTANMQAPE